VGLSVSEVINTVKKVTGIDFKVENAPRRAGDPPKLIADSSLIKDTLKWIPKSDNIDKIIENSWLWEKKLKGI
jgi:UDP-glucose 4-epimerase